MINALGTILSKLFGPRGAMTIDTNTQRWFQTEYGKNWEHAYNNYVVTGSIHFQG